MAAKRRAGGSFASLCDARPVLAKLRITTLLAQGMEDQVCAAQLLLDAANACENPLVTLKALSPCGHAAFEDCREEFVKLPTDFCQP